VTIDPARAASGERRGIHVDHEAKGKLGFEDRQNRSVRAVERTAPFAVMAYTLVIVDYVASAAQRSSP
jgi:hypothetical protein